MGVDASQARNFAIGLRATRAKVMPLAAAIVTKTVADTKRDAQTLAPVDTGNLRSSISGTTKRGATTVEGTVGTSVEYAIYQEFGTSRQPGTPFLMPSFDRNAPLFEKAAEQIGRLL